MLQISYSDCSKISAVFNLTLCQMETTGSLLSLVSVLKWPQLNSNSFFSWICRQIFDLCRRVRCVWSATMPNRDFEKWKAGFIVWDINCQKVLLLFLVTYKETNFWTNLMVCLCFFVNNLNFIFSKSPQNTLLPAELACFFCYSSKGKETLRPF